MANYCSELPSSQQSASQPSRCGDTDLAVHSALAAAPQAPLHFCELQSSGGADGMATVAVFNERSFADTVDLALFWRLLADGSPVIGTASPLSTDDSGWAALKLAEPVAPQVGFVCRSTATVLSVCTKQTCHTMQLYKRDASDDPEPAKLQCGSFRLRVLVPVAQN